MSWVLKLKSSLSFTKKKYKDIYNKLTLGNLQYFKLYINESEPGTFWYVLLNSNLFFLVRVFIYFFGVLSILILFSFYKTFKQHESLFVFIYIIWFFSSLFYIEFLRV
jgi:hypothetical protein